MLLSDDMLKRRSFMPVPKVRLAIVWIMLLVAISACQPSASSPTTIAIQPTANATAAPAASATPVASATEDNNDAEIELEGEISAVDGPVIVVSGLRVDTSSASISGALQVGVRVKVTGVLLPDTSIRAVVIVIVVNNDDDDDDGVTGTPQATTTAGTPQATATAGTPQATATLGTPQATATLGTPQAIATLGTPQATATLGTATVTPVVSPTASAGGDVIIVIEGPVQSININIITIFGLEIEVNANDPILTVLQIGDVIRVEGSMNDDDDDNSPRLILVAVTVIIVNVDVVINVDGQVWRDPGDCANRPPDWAPANGWRRRCEGGGNNGGGNGNGNGGGDDDDDD
jgi:hypothetical protein